MFYCRSRKDAGATFFLPASSGRSSFTKSWSAEKEKKLLLLSTLVVAMNGDVSFLQTTAAAVRPQAGSKTTLFDEDPSPAVAPLKIKGTWEANNNPYIDAATHYKTFYLPIIFIWGRSRRVFLKKPRSKTVLFGLKELCKLLHFHSFYS